MARVLGLLVLLLAAGFVPAAHAEDHIDVIVNGRSTVSIPASALAHDVGLVRCTTRSASDESDDDHGDTSLRAIATAANVAPGAVQAMDVAHPGAPAAHITGEEVRKGFDGDPLGHRDAMVFYNGDGFWFVRPLRGGDDLNAPDGFALSIHETLKIRLTTTDTTLRTVKASPDATELSDGESTGFNVVVTNPDGGEPFTYTWDFGDGTEKTDPSPEHTFSAGTWQVTVTALGSDGSYGVSDPITIHVKSKTQSTPTATPTSTTGPGDENGNDQPQAPTSGSASPTAGPAGSPAAAVTGTPPAGATGTPRTSSTPGPRRTSTPAHSPTATATATPSRTASFGAPAPAPTFTGVATPTPQSSAAPKHATPTPAQTAAPPPPASAGVPVSGILLAGAGDRTDLAQILQSVDQSPSAVTEPRQVRRGGEDSRDWLGWASGGGLLLVLLAGGAARERRRIAA